MDNEDFMRFMAAWALVHETADEGWKAAVERGSSQEASQMVQGADAFVDGLAAMIAEQKERLKAELARGGTEPVGSKADLAAKLDEIGFEIGELRGRIESMQATLDSIAADDDLTTRE